MIFSASPRLFAALTLLSALVAILALDAHAPTLPREWGFAAKPLTTLLIIAFAWQRGRATPQLRRWVLAGLVASLAGDVLLMLPQGFVPGLLAFLAAHACYLLAFTRVRRLAAWPWSFAGYGLLSALLLTRLWPGIPPALHLPVAFYVCFLAAMAAQTAVVAWFGRGTPAARRDALLALGGALFLTSDTCLAFNKFAGPLPVAAMLVLPTYWAAQCCIANWLAPRATG
ncbi:lysoplasmalogenase [Roseateles violae]|uniref:Lysoplasmalogenase n=1 Tax=Roseateles violae TaxID=3058042 RepID=A0ABT8DMP0_9BURK|nr:lysoplasmalogenase [Pelomonas sp. PFR6]MDN3919645.1 lysoplasmalogenase [Pelomonas sp. PFR6]